MTVSLAAVIIDICEKILMRSAMMLSVVCSFIILFFLRLVNFSRFSRMKDNSPSHLCSTAFLLRNGYSSFSATASKNAHLFFVPPIALFISLCYNVVKTAKSRLDTY